MANFYCEYCGEKASNVRSLVGANCIRHPFGSNKGKHKLYEGSEKSQYTCKYCGANASNIRSLVNINCIRHPNGSNKGKHAPAL